MAINNFPSQNGSYTYLQTNRSDDTGSLWATFNCDFQRNLGTLQLGTKMVVNTDTSTQADLATVGAFSFFDTKLFAAADNYVWVNAYNTGTISGTLTSAFVKDASAGTPTSNVNPDLCVFNSALVVSANSKFYSKASNGSGTGAWTDRGAVPNAGVNNFCRLLYFKKFNRMYMKGLTTIQSVNTAWTIATSGDYFIDLSSEIGQIVDIASNSTSIWIACYRIKTLLTNEVSLQASVFEWDGISAQPTNEYKIDSTGILAITIKDDRPYILDRRGRFMEFNGNGFTEVCRFPVDRDLLCGIDTTGESITPNTRFIHPNGITITKDGTFKFLVNNGLEGNANNIVTIENLPSGIWEYSSEFGLTHKSALSLKKANVATINEYGGSGNLLRVGAMMEYNSSDLSSTGRSTVICGAQIFFGASYSVSSRYAIFIDSPMYPATDVQGQKRGYFITTWFNSNAIADKWQRLWITYRRLLTSTDNIVAKYRLYEEDSITAEVQWSSPTLFSTTTDVTAYGPTASGFNGTIGGEVEVLAGGGAGFCGHITSIVFSGGLYIVTLDNPIAGVQLLDATVRFQKWIKLLPEITGQVKSYEQMNINSEVNPRCQLKVCMAFTDTSTQYNEFHKLALVSNEDIKPTL